MSDPSPLPPSEPWPAELRVQNNGALFKVTFEDGVVGSLSAERLREASPSADKTRQPPPAGVALAIVEVEQVGNYAVRIGFNDGHSTGIYTWRLLRSLTTH
ncbi:MAG TPA: gamma-butyrobetaine hydroxylase-like domain-containing protein [Roseiarcus sp.]|nr:gamma-butyrobetaine hydroxylase-like domain-containing protein [Roseiarcus sp.]